MAGFRALFFLYNRKKNRMKQILNTLTISDFISKCTNYIYNTNTHIYYRLIIPIDNLFAADLSTG